MNLGLGVMSVVITAVMFPKSGMTVAFIIGGAEADIRETKLPIPIQNAMTSPDASPTRAPWKHTQSMKWNHTFNHLHKTVHR